MFETACEADLYPPRSRRCMTTLTGASSMLLFVVVFFFLHTGVDVTHDTELFQIKMFLSVLSCRFREESLASADELDDCRRA